MDRTVTQPYDVAIVGGGIIGLAHAWMAARRGASVIVFERSRQASGASVRNFGMLWPIGQPFGIARQRAERSLTAWRQLISEAGLWSAPVGSLHLAREADEAAVLEEFRDQARQHGVELSLEGADATARRAPRLRHERLQSALFSPHEISVAPRQVLERFPRFLQERHGVDMRFETLVTGIDGTTITTSRGAYRAHRAIVCAGEEVQLLYPDALASAGLRRCKLQMMSLGGFGPPGSFGPMVAGGLTLAHYRSFAACPSLPALRARLEVDRAPYLAHGIHVMAAQGPGGELIVGDSHEWQPTSGPFDSDRIEQLIIEDLIDMVAIENATVTERWHGHYLAHPADSVLRLRPAEHVDLVMGVGGAGMTLSMGLAEETFAS